MRQKQGMTHQTKLLHLILTKVGCIEVIFL